MKFENIVKRLRQDGVMIYEGEFEFKPVSMVHGTALIDLVNGEVVPTTAKYSDVVSQIQNGKSHIMTIEGKKRYLTEYEKLH